MGLLFGKRRKHKYINGTRGVISIFLALLMAPFAMVAGALINVGRTCSAVSIFDEALCNASNSTLGTYDSFLKKRFGLLAIKQGNTGKVDDVDVQEFIDGIFSDYMSVNCESLPGAYSSEEIETNANGVYPLSDMAVLKKQVLEYSKYRVPAKLLADGIDLEKLIDDVRKCIPGHEFFDAIISGADEVDNVITTGECISNLKTAVQTQEVGKENYLTAYSNFETAVKDYNEKESAFDSAKSDFDKAAEDLQSAGEEAYAGAETTYDSAKEAYDTAETEFEAAKEALIEKKGVYQGTIASLISYINNVKSKKQALSDAIAETASGGMDLLVEVDKVTTNQVKTSNREIEEDRKARMAENDKEKEELAKGLSGSDGGSESDEDMKKRAESISKYYEENEALQDELNSLEEVNNRFQNGDTLLSKSVKAGEDYLGGYKDHYKVFQDAGYAELTEKLELLAKKVNEFGPEEDTTNFTKDEYFENVDFLLKEAEIDALDEFICNEASGDTGFGLLKAVVSFLNALINIGLQFNPELVNMIDMEHYKSMGGLPSEHGDSHSEFEESDSEASRRYKELMGSFSVDDTVYTGNVLDDVMNLIKNLLKLTSDLAAFVSPSTILELGSRLKSIYNDACKIVEGFCNICVNFAFPKIADAFKRKILPAGYIHYNVPCRTNFDKYEDKGGLSEPFGSLRNETSLSFGGAEVEYIIFGSESEIENQTGAFWTLYVLRWCADCFPIATNVEVQSILEAVSAIPFIGWLLGIIVFVVILFAEPMVDTILLCGGGKVPLYKSYVYLTPSGLLNFATAMTNLKLQGDYKKEYDELKKQLKVKSPTASKYKGFIELDYSQYMLLLCSLFVSEDIMYKRLADVIEMEGSCNAKKSGDSFNLMHSYTYLRASGNFKGRMFISMSDNSVLKSSNRVVYQGY